MPKDSSAKYYQGNKERLQKEEKRPYGREQHKNLPEDEKQKPVEYIEIYTQIIINFFLLYTLSVSILQYKGYKKFHA